MASTNIRLTLPNGKEINVSPDAFDKALDKYSPDIYLPHGTVDLRRKVIDRVGEETASGRAPTYLAASAWLIILAHLDSLMGKYEVDVDVIRDADIEPGWRLTSEPRWEATKTLTIAANTEGEAEEKAYDIVDVPQDWEIDTVNVINHTPAEFDWA